ncbi:MAG: hypothetical protein ACLQQ4_05760 [Bacteroidia bacterium]
MRHKYLLLFCVLLCAAVCAQNKGSYGNDFSLGNKLLQENKFASALACFMRAYNVDSSSANINYKIGRCYLGIPGKKDMAVKYLEKAAKDITAQYDAANPQQTSAPQNAYFYLGMAYHYAGKFGEAINSFKAFRKYVLDKDSLAEIDHRIEQGSNARMFLMAPGKAKVINMGDSINSPYSAYNALVPADEASIIFTSDRPTGKEGEVHSYIYTSIRKNDSSWSMPQMFDKTLNGMVDNVSSFISADGQQLFIDGNNGKTSSVLTSFPEDTHWSAPEDPGGDINNPPTATNVCLSPDGTTLYFVSERPGGFGGKDIWRCVKLPNGKWSLAVNLGGTINTRYNEETPFMHIDGKTFFFSSEGHTGIGGYDIFFTQLLDNGNWVEPFNLGYPINTPHNETHFSLSADGKHAYLTSDRPGGKGAQDIYLVIMPGSSEKPLTVIKGAILLDGGKPLPDDVHILVTDNVTGEIVGDFKPVKSTGAFTIIVPPGKSYTLSYENGSKEFYNEIIEVPADAGYKEIRKALTLSPFTWKVTAIDTLSNGSQEEQK